MRHQTFAMLAVGGTLLLVLAPVGPAAAQVACGDTITEDTVLDEDLDCRGAGTNPALTVMGPATLDLNGHLLTCSSGSFIGEGVRLEGARARLVDGSVTGCRGNSGIGFAVVLAGDGNHTLRDLTLTGNSFGVDVRGTDNTGNRIERNSIEPSMNVGLSTGIQVSGLDTRVSGNHVDRAVRGIDLVSGSSSTTVIDNVVTGSTEGIHVNSSANTIQHNELSGNNTGIRLIGVIPAAPGGALSNVIAGNQATGNGTDLIDENPGCDDNDWHGNIFDTADPEDCID
jgi:parallel beta-helix repeat protein